MERERELDHTFSVSKYLSRLIFTSTLIIHLIQKIKIKKKQIYYIYIYMIFLNHFSFFKIRQVIKDNKYLRIDGFRTMTGQSGATSNKLMGRRPWMLLL
jgi:hypothetical protein